MGRRLTATECQEVAHRLLTAMGAPEDIAQHVSRSLVASDLAGVASHGIAMLPHYHRYWQTGWFDPTARAELVNETASTAVLDGKWGFGQPTAHWAAQLVIEKTRAVGIAAASILHSGHIGRLGEYVELAAEAGIVAIVLASAGPAGGRVVPFGGMEPVFNTNPLAAGIPAKKNHPFIMDIATSKVARGKIQNNPDLDGIIPQGWAISPEGLPATTVHEALDGFLVPFGEHKGYALALFIELLCGALTGAGCSTRPERVTTWGAGGNAVFIIGINISSFTDPDSYFANVDSLLNRVKGVKPAPGFTRVVIPGEPEAEQRATKVREGIEIEEEIWQRLLGLAAKHQLTFDDILS